MANVTAIAPESKDRELTSPASDRPMVTVVVPTYRRFPFVLATVRDLLKQRYTRYEIIVVDQNSDWPRELEAEREELGAHPRVVWMRHVPPGVVAARNEAVHRSRGEIIIFVDDDVCIPDDRFIERHVNNYSDSGVGAVAGREENLVDAKVEASGGMAACEPNDVVGLERDPIETVLGFNRNSTQRVEVCVFSTCNSSVSRNVFMSLQGFDENFSGNSYGDDSDFALRLHAARKWKIVFDPYASLVHLRAPLGGLRLSDPSNGSSHLDRVVSGWLFYLRHARRGFRWHILYTQILRRTILLRSNLRRPWRELGAVFGLIHGYCLARRRCRRGVVSRFSCSVQKSTRSGK